MASWVDYWLKRKSAELCKDCRWYEPDETFREYDKSKMCEFAICGRTRKTVPYDEMKFVCGYTGSRMSSSYCSTERKFGCGKRGKHFEPK